jgi:competence protein ComGC
MNKKGYTVAELVFALMILTAFLLLVIEILIRNTILRRLP